MTQLLKNKRQQSSLKQVTYQVFRQTLNKAAGQRVKNKRHSTVVYDYRGNLLAMLKNASIDPVGRSQPAQYFIR